MKAFFATTLAGYDIESVPRFETTSAAVYSRLTRAKRGLWRGHGGKGHSEGKKIEQTFHQRSTSATSARNAAFSVDMALDEGGLKC